MLPDFLELVDVPTQHNEMHRKLFKFTFPIVIEETATIPNTDNIPVGFGMWFDDGTTRRLYFNKNGVLLYLEWKNAA